MTSAAPCEEPRLPFFVYGTLQTGFGNHDAVVRGRFTRARAALLRGGGTGPHQEGALGKEGGGASAGPGPVGTYVGGGRQWSSSSNAGTGFVVFHFADEGYPGMYRVPADDAAAATAPSVLGQLLTWEGCPSPAAYAALLADLDALEGFTAPGAFSNAYEREEVEVEVEVREGEGEDEREGDGGRGEGEGEGGGGVGGATVRAIRAWAYFCRMLPSAHGGVRVPPYLPPLRHPPSPSPSSSSSSWAAAGAASPPAWPPAAADWARFVREGGIQDSTDSWEDVMRIDARARAAAAAAAAEAEAEAEADAEATLASASPSPLVSTSSIRSFFVYGTLMTGFDNNRSVVRGRVSSVRSAALLGGAGELFHLPRAGCPAMVAPPKSDHCGGDEATTKATPAEMLASQGRGLQIGGGDGGGDGGDAGLAAAGSGAAAGPVPPTSSLHSSSEFPVVRGQLLTVPDADFLQVLADMDALEGYSGRPGDPSNPYERRAVRVVVTGGAGVGEGEGAYVDCGTGGVASFDNVPALPPGSTVLAWTYFCRLDVAALGGVRVPHGDWRRHVEETGADVAGADWAERAGLSSCPQPAGSHVWD